MDDASSDNIVHVRRRESSGHILAARVGSSDVSKKVTGWRIMQRKVSGEDKVLLVPTSATRSKRHWYLDAGESICGQIIVWRRASKAMKWVPLPNTLRESTMRRKVDRQVAFLSPALSPPLRKREKSGATTANKGCKCALGAPCKRLRLESAAAGRLPHCEPRLATFPSTKQVFIFVFFYFATYTHTHNHTHTQTWRGGAVARW